MVSTPASTVGPPAQGPGDSVCDFRASIRRRSRGGISAITLVSACTDVSSSPPTDPAAAVRRPTAIATASSSSSSSGGSEPPARSW